MKNISFYITFSWDDGHPLDLRVAELMAKYGIAGTFYLPITNQEGLPVMSALQILELSHLAEIGSHTYSHCYLAGQDKNTIKREVTDGKAALEDILGRPIEGFCYPGGQNNQRVQEAVESAGFVYARTIENFRWDRNGDPFRLPTTLQFFPHTSMVYLCNYLSKGNWSSRQALFYQTLGIPDLLSRCICILNYAGIQQEPVVLHFWGHSYEIEEMANGWALLETFFKYIHDTPSVKITNRQLFEIDYCQETPIGSAIKLTD